MKEKILAHTLKMFLAFFLLGCVNTNALTSESPSTGLQSTTSTETPPPVLQPATFTKTPSNVIRDNLMIAVASKDYGTIFLVESATGHRQRLDISEDTAKNVIGWANNGCTLFVETEKERVIKVDIQGNILAEIADINSLNVDAAVTRIKISPDEQWIALILGTGNQGFASYEFQNLITLSSQNSKEIHKLTEDGIVNDVSWKFDSSMIAFTDKDNDNIQQIFVSSPIGSNRTQLTHLNKMSLTIKSLKWSPTGEKIAFVIADEEKHESYLGIVETGGTDNLIFITSVIGVNEFFWLPNDIIIADVLPSGKDSSKLANRAIAWFNSDTGQEVGRINATTLPSGIFLLPGPLPYSDRIGFFSDDNFYTYDISSTQMDKGFDVFTDIRYWISAPKIVDADSCHIPK